MHVSCKFIACCLRGTPVILFARVSFQQCPLCGVVAIRAEIGLDFESISSKHVCAKPVCPRARSQKAPTV